MTEIKDKRKSNDSIISDHKLMINGACSQYDRWLKALNHDYAKVDGHTFSEMLQFAVDFGGLINFFNLNNEVDGDWVDFFLSDPGVVMASIEAVDLNNIEQRFYSLLKQTTETAHVATKLSLFKECFLFIQKIVQQINDWHYALEMIESDKKIKILRSDLRILIETRLKTQFDKLKVYAKGASLAGGLRKTIELDLSKFMAVWDIGSIRPDVSIYNGDNFEKKINSACNFLIPIYEEFYAAIAELKTSLDPQAPLGDINSNHRPQVALLMAFIRLYQQSQNTINTMSDRYVRFYYDEVLKEKQNVAIPDTLYLNFTLADEESVSSATVPVATRFSAGQGKDDQDIIYAANKSLLVYAAEIEKLLTLYVEYGPLLCEPYGNNEEYNSENNLTDQLPVVKRILISDISVEETKNNPDFVWPVFGAPVNSEHPIQNSDALEKLSSLAKTGFSISSPYLWLSGGDRYVSLDIQCTEIYAENILNPLLQQIHQATGESKESIFFKVLTNAFVLYGSSTAQWFEIENYTIGSAIEPNNDPCCFSLNSKKSQDNQLLLERTFRLCFKLPETAPPLVPFATEEDVAGDEEISNNDGLIGNLAGIDLTVPTLLVYLRQQAVKFLTSSGEPVSVYPISLLDKMSIERFQVSTKVSNLSELEITNTNGEIDPVSPFTVFGSLPVVGSYLYIYKKELFVKVPQQLCVTIDWFNLPQNETGFKGYYQYYDINIDGNVDPELFNNQTFHAKFSLLNQGNWSLTTLPYDNKSLSLDDQKVYLFSSKTEDDNCINPPQKETPLCSVSQFNNFKIASTEHKYPDYYNPEESAIKLELSGPTYSFGNDIYAKNVLNSVIEDLPDTDSCRDFCLCEYRPVFDVITCLNVCMDICLKIPDEADCFSCIEKKLFLGETALCAAIIQWLSESFIKYSDLLVENIYLKIENHINSCMALQSSERLKAIEDCFVEIKNVSKKYNTSVENSNWKKCNKYIDALKLVLTTVSCIHGCKLDAIEKSKSCIENCLQINIDKLQVLYEICLTDCMDNCMQIDQELKYPNEPYLPQASDIKINYDATCTLFDINSSKVDVFRSQCGRSTFSHILPFNGSREVDLNTTNAIPLLASYTQSGNLYVGFSNLNQAQQLTLLFLLRENNGVDLPAVQWDILSNNRWQCLSLNNVDADTTHGLKNTGIVSLNIPSVDNVNNTILSSEFTWLRVSTKIQSNLFPNTNAVIPYTLLATQQINQNEVDTVNQELNGNLSVKKENNPFIGTIKNPLIQSLPAHTINSSIEEIPDIGSIDQPISSFGGRAAETYQAFEVRQGERLHHKKRAIQLWDYERLVLDEFPVIWKVKVLPAHNLLTGNKPGEILLVVLIGPDSIDSQDPITPVASSELINNIQVYINSLATTFLKLHICNPVYVRIGVTAKVIFKQDNNGSDNIERLNNELIQYLSPWFYDESREEKAGEYTSKDDISFFIQTRPYVNSLESISLDYFPDIRELKTDWYFLTSTKQHDITTFSNESCRNIDFNY